MAGDKQLLNVNLDQVIEKRRLDQALNAKEFAVLAGISYSSARAWFRLPSFPAVCGVVFWQDFVQWRNAQAASRSGNHNISQQGNAEIRVDAKSVVSLPPRAAKILAEAG